MNHEKTARNPKGAGRKPKPEREALRKKRQFFMLEKNDRTAALMKAAHTAHRRITGKDGTDAEVLRTALADYIRGASQITTVNRQPISIWEDADESYLGAATIAKLRQANETDGFGDVELDPISGLPEHLFRNDEGENDG